MQIWVIMHYQHDISALVPQTSFLGKTSGGIVKCWLFSKAATGAKIVETLYSNRVNSENKVDQNTQHHMEGMEEEKLYCPILKSIKRQKAPLGQCTSSNHVANCSLIEYVWQFSVLMMG